MAARSAAPRRPLDREALPRGGLLGWWPLLALLCAASATTVVVLGTRLTFFNDDWWFLLQRPGLESHGGLDTLLAPHNGNVVVLLALIYKALVAIFGLASQLPFRLVMGLTIAGLGALVYAFVAKRLGPAIGLAAAAVVLFLGPAWEDLLFFGAFLDLGGALLAGLAALMLMEVDSPPRNAIACALLVCAISLSNAGLPFAAGAALAVLLRRRPSQLWIPAIPAALFGLWWSLEGSKGPSYVTLRNVEHLPRYVLDSVSYGLASITGLNHAGTSAVAGHVLAGFCGLLLVIWLLRGGRPSGWSLVLAVTALAFWILTGASFIPGREPFASRYQLVDGTLLIVLVAELLRERRLGRALTAAVSLIAVLVVASNIASLARGFDFMQRHSAYAKADLGALAVVRPLAPSNLWLLAPVARDPYLSGVTAGRYFAQTRAHGTPAFYTPAQIAAAPPAQRQAADSVLASAYRLVRKAIRPAAPSACLRLAAGAGKPGPATQLRPGTVLVKSSSKELLVVGVSRFAPRRLPVYAGFLAPGAPIRLVVPGDTVALPWYVSVMAGRRQPAAAATVCRA